MKAPTVNRRQSVGFNVTSLIDIVFLLVIFFLVASHVARSDAVEPVELPEASQVQHDDEQTPQRLVVTVMFDRTLHVSGRAVSLAELEQLILTAKHESKTPFEVRIRSDRNATYAEVEPILLACARLGVNQVGFAVLPRREP